MGNQQPKKIGKASKSQIQIACLKSRIHLELMRDRKNAQIIKGQKQLVKKIKSASRNKTEEVLLIEKITYSLKYTQACHHLIGYAGMLKPQAQFISKNMYNPEKMEPFLTPIYTLIYAAEVMGLSSLQEFRALMKALNDPTTVGKYVNQEVLQLLSPRSTPQEMNIYVMEMAQRNDISLEEINIIGHKFTKDTKPIQNFSEIQRQLAEKMRKQGQQKPGNYGGGQGGNDGYGGQGGNYYGNPGGQGGNYYGNPGGQGGNYYGNPGGQGGNYYGSPGSSQGTGNFGGQYGSFGAGNNQPDFQKPLPPVPPTQMSVDSSESSNPYGIRQSFNPNSAEKTGNNLYPQNQPNKYQDSRISVNSINDLDYFPQITPIVKPDPQFDKICEILRAAM